MADLPGAVLIARCPEHGLHGERDECFECGGPVEQVEMIEVALLPTENGLPGIPGVIAGERYMALRQHAADGKLGDATIECTTTAGLGGLAILVEVKPPGRDTVYVIYDVAPHVQAIAAAVLELDRANAEAGR